MKQLWTEIRKALSWVRRIPWRVSVAVVGWFYDRWTEVLVGVADALFEFDVALSCTGMWEVSHAIRRRVAKRTHGA